MNQRCLRSPKDTISAIRRRRAKGNEYSPKNPLRRPRKSKDSGTRENPIYIKTTPKNREKKIFTFDNSPPPSYDDVINNRV